MHNVRSNTSTNLQIPLEAINDTSSLSDRFSTPELISPPSSRPTSRTESPFVVPRNPIQQQRAGTSVGSKAVVPDNEEGFDEWNAQAPGDSDSDTDMPSDLRPSLNRHNDGKSYQPLLAKTGEEHGYDSPPRPALSRRSTFHERDPDGEARYATKRRYTYAAFFLVLSLVSFAVQTETAVYIQSQLHWQKAYCMLYFTHGSWSLLWPTQLLILRLQKWNTPWKVFWRRHVQILRQTAQMVQHRTLHPAGRQVTESPWPYMMRTTAFVTCALTIAGSSWYVAVNLTTASDLTAIYNCSAFFAYAFSIPLLHERVRLSKVAAVAVAIIGVLVVAYGGESSPKHGNKSGGGAGGPDHDADRTEHQFRFIGNLIIGVGSIMYGFYEVLYKKVACPPEDCSPGRGMIFANAFGSMIGFFTLTILWIPLPILHYTGIETFELPHGQAAWMMLVSVLSNAVFSGSFLVLISLTSPVLSSVAALLTIFIVAIIDQLLPPPLNSPLSAAAIAGGTLIIGAFVVLAWATYREMDEERRKKLAGEVEESDIDD